MVIRIILRYLANNEQLVQRLSESGPVRSAARFVVFLFNRGKSIAEERGLHQKLSPEQLKEAAKKFTQNVKDEIKQAQEELKRRK